MTETCAQTSVSSHIRRDPPAVREALTTGAGLVARLGAFCCCCQAGVIGAGLMIEA